VNLNSSGCSVRGISYLVLWGRHCRDAGLQQSEDSSRIKRLAAASENMLCMEYAMATVRLVNGIADSAQKGKVATSVASLASFAGKLTHLWQSANSL